MHPDDCLVLEDESGRVNLRGNVLLPSVYVTGLDTLGFSKLCLKKLSLC